MRVVLDQERLVAALVEMALAAHAAAGVARLGVPLGVPLGEPTHEAAEIAVAPRPEEWRSPG